MSHDPHFHEERRDGTWLMIERDFEDAARALGLHEPSVLAELVTSGDHGLGSPGGQGRALTTILPLPGQGERLHLRHVLHGGLLGDLWRGRLAGPGRVRDELLATAQLRARGAAVPRPALAMAVRTGLLWRASLATVHEEGAIDGLAFLAAGPSRERLCAAAAAAGSTLRRFHDLGGQHRDLHIKNLLFREDAGTVEVVLIDLDRAGVATRVSPSRRARELMRLQRSLRKRKLLEQVGARGCAAFFAAYHAGDHELRTALLATRGRWSLVR